MGLTIISCGIFRLELEKIHSELEAELGCGVELDFLPSALDVKADLLEKAVTEKFVQHEKQKTVLLYGSMCHTEWPRIIRTQGAVYPKPSNCAEILLSPERKKAFDERENIYFLAMSGLKNWKEIYRQDHGWDDADALVNFGYFEKIVVLDTGVFEISEEDLFEFFDYTQKPVEVMQISLDYFKSLVLDLCRKQLADNGE
jgi:hypothetical protein